METSSIKELVKNAEFKFNKSLGQNFIFDSNLLDAIVADSGVGENDVVVEIGTGSGTLTHALAKKAKKVYSFEVDENLKGVLSVSLQGDDNVEIIFRDVLKMTDDELKSIVGGEFCVVANLPYYVTTPLVLRFIESSLNVKSMTVMVQQEVANRFVAKVGSPDYASITLAILICANAYETRKVDRRVFYPVPKVDSAVVRIDFCRDKLQGKNTPELKKLIRAAFAMRRKTLVNNLCSAFGLEKAAATDLVTKAGFSPLVRGEALSLDDYVKLADMLAEIK